MFDAYLNNTMSNAERDGFEKQLNDDADLSHIQYQLYDHTGRLLQQNMLTDYNTILSLGRYASGMYYLVIRDAESVLHNAKIIKQ